MTAEHESYIFVLTHQLLPHLYTVIGFGVARRVGRILLALKPAAVTGEISVSVDNYSVRGVSRDDLARPRENVVVCAVIKEHNEVFCLADGEFCIGVVDLVCLIEALALIGDIGIGKLCLIVGSSKVGIKGAARIVVSTDKVVRKLAVELGDSRLCMLPVCCVGVVIGDVSESENVLDLLALLVGKYPIIELSGIVGSVLNVVLYHILSITDDSKGIRVIARSVGFGYYSVGGKASEVIVSVAAL